MSKSEFLWVEKYRPQTIEDCILPASLKKTFQQIVDTGEMHNMLLSGSAGLGKTTVARALCNQLNLEYIIINASEENGIDVLRSKIKQFASSVSLTGGIKVVILDEADYLNAQSTQPALRGFIEEFSGNCRFILTCNFKNRIIEPLHSRCSVIEFNTTKKQLAVLAGGFMKRLQYMLTTEGVDFNNKILAELIMRYAPDWRRVINECQRYSSSGEITSDILIGLSDQNIAALVGFLKIKDFKSMRSWVTNNTDIDSSVIFRRIYDTLYDFAQPQSIPAIILILADYQYKVGFVADKELNTVACLTEIMASSEWK
jgi:DNA polymerase III delta prime subunit|tara:strand:- start:5513 stop:6454 length:942 start_codon:yes stop_codon:yes gene_type:complete